MADINARLKRALDGKGPQFKVFGKEEFDFVEGSDGDMHTKVRRSNVTESLMKDTDLSPGNNYINFEALGNAFGLGIYTVQNASVTIRLTYIIPGTTNFTLQPYEDILTMENDDRAIIRYENIKSSHVRMIVRNEGVEPIQVKSLHVTHFL